MTLPASSPRPYATPASLEVATSLVQGNLPYDFSQEEAAIIAMFFTNTNGQVFFVKNLPPGIVASLCSMYSRISNPRRIRGVFLDTFLPSVLASGLAEVEESETYSENPERFLIDHGIKNLNGFLRYSRESKDLFLAFCAAFDIDSKIYGLLTNSKKASRFIRTWLDKYGHNSVARMGAVTLCLEQVSMLAAKSVEWSRPGAGFVELSSRYVSMSGSDVYPFWQELATQGVDPSRAQELITSLFRHYREMQGEKFTGYFPEFLRETYAETFANQEKNLETGVVGETCDVAGNLLPACTLTSLAVTMMGEAMASTLRHLLLDATAENQAIVQAIVAEGTKIGVDQFMRHYNVTESDFIDWEYPDVGAFRMGRYVSLDQAVLSTRDIERMIFLKFKQRSSCESFDTIQEIANFLYGDEGRTSDSFRKLPREFEGAVLSFSGTMPFRDWRDLQRMGMSAHKRTLLTPYLGFYEYDKPAPAELGEAFRSVTAQAEEVYDHYSDQGICPTFLQYMLPLGFMVGFSYDANLRQLEFANWQRSKPDVNHSVRQTFLGIEKHMRRVMPWFEDFSRTNMVPGYIFARGSKIPLKP